MDGDNDRHAADGSVESLLGGLFDAIDRQDIDAVLAHFASEARIPDSLESAIVVGRDQIRAYYLRQFATIHVSASLLSTRRLPDGRVEADLHVQLRGAEGGSWGERRVKAIYRIDDGRISEMVVDEAVGI